MDPDPSQGHGHNFKGIQYDGARRKFTAKVSLKAGEKAALPENLRLKALNGGSFPTAEEAAKAADRQVICKEEDRACMCSSLPCKTSGMREVTYPIPLGLAGSSANWAAWTMACCPKQSRKRWMPSALKS